MHLHQVQRSLLAVPVGRWLRIAATGQVDGKCQPDCSDHLLCLDGHHQEFVGRFRILLGNSEGMQQSYSYFHRVEQGDFWRRSLVDLQFQVVALLLRSLPGTLARLRRDVPTVDTTLPIVPWFPASVSPPVPEPLCVGHNSAPVVLEQDVICPGADRAALGLPRH